MAVPAVSPRVMLGGKGLMHQRSSPRAAPHPRGSQAGAFSSPRLRELGGMRAGAAAQWLLLQGMEPWRPGGQEGPSQSSSSTASSADAICHSQLRPQPAAALPSTAQGHSLPLLPAARGAAELQTQAG